ncbi:cytochrome P450 [Legionella clemsonensis]|uniref:Cytochrome P450 n=1 Tax=Legionella clemsonensis TaxID=1867846 RepID=A0A222P2Q5_9GAMM|nr:cytochrome P450 [Legionella clemsonensis]ASQ46107.1 Cytochrome P450 [Legionella clemsonensis]
MPQSNKGNKVIIKTVRKGGIANLVNKGQELFTKIVEYGKGVGNLYRLIINHNAVQDPNAFHKLLEEQYSKISNDTLKVLTIPIFSPTKSQVYDRVVAIGNPVILQALRRIPRAETVSPSYFETHPDTPKISGGRAFGSVLEAIGMGILSADSEIHTPFIQEMISTLTIKSIEDNENQFSDNKYKKRFIQVIKEETAQLVAAIRNAAESSQDEICYVDFRFYALKIFLRGFYPHANWQDRWINELSQEIETVSDLAFKCMVNPHADLNTLRAEANKRLSAYIDRIMLEDQTFYLRESYVKSIDKEILRQIIVSLLFAGGDNIKKYLDHVFVEFGNDKIRERYLSKTPTAEALKLYITEVGRLYTTIYAQPGEALEDFIIEYKDETIPIKAGDKLHYSTWIANRDPQEWGPFANEFKPEENQQHYNRLQPLATFGDGSRVCRGKSITLAIIEYLTAKVLEEFRWKSYVDGQDNSHPTEFNFNNGVQGKPGFIFMAVKKQQLERDSPTSEMIESNQLSHWRITGNSDGVASKLGKFKQPLQIPDNLSTQQHELSFTYN